MKPLIRTNCLLLALALMATEATAAACDAARGRQSFENKCAMCHTSQPGTGHGVGPNLAGVVGRPVASGEGFGYSEVLKQLGGQWTEQQLDRFLSAPQKLVPGTAMPFQGLKSAPEREAVICHLNTLN